MTPGANNLSLAKARRAGVVSLLALAAVGALLALRAPTVLLWNATSSVPIGLYWLSNGRDYKRHDLVVTHLPPDAARVASERRYLPDNVPLIKPVAAVSGQTVCRENNIVTVDGRRAATSLARDSLGRDLPVWNGCRTVEPEQLFLMNAAVRDSFDGRYFGPIDRNLVIGRATPIVTFVTPSSQSHLSSR